MKKQRFYDLKKKKIFESSNYKFTSKKNPKTGKMTYFIHCKSPSGSESYRIVDKEWYMENKK